MNCVQRWCLRRRRIRLLVLSLSLVGFIVPVSDVQLARAQETPAETSIDPRISADAARCLAIDAEITDLAAQVRSKQITPEARKQSADALTAERTRITSSYARNTPQNRTFLAEFNRLKTAAITASREAAAAETKAKRDAAAAEQKEKRDAAAASAVEKERLAAQAEDALTADVSAVVDEKIQRARDKFYQDFGLTPPNPPTVAQQQTAAAKALRANHVPPASAELRPPFDQRVGQIYNQRLPDRTNEWFAAVFPAASDVTALFAKPEQQSAALGIVAKRLEEHTSGVRPPEAQAKLQAYQIARNSLKTDFDAVNRLMRDKEFETQVFEKSLPRYALSLRQQAFQEKITKEREAFHGAVKWLGGLIRLCVLGVFLWLPIRIVRRQAFRWKRQSKADWETLMANSPLPKELWWIEVPGFRYPVTVFSGLVYEKEVWTETQVTTSTSTTGGNYTGSYYTPAYTTTRTHVSSTVYHRYWMTTTEGKQTWHRYSDNEFIATGGQKVSSLWSDNYWVLLAYNHVTQSLSAPGWWTKAMHRPPYWRMVGIPLAAGLLVAITLAVVASPALPHTTDISFSDRMGILGDELIASLIILVPILLIYAAIIRTVYTIRRQKHFEKNIVPKYRSFFAAYVPVIPEVTKA